MTLSNPFVDETGIRFPTDVGQIDVLENLMTEHIARVSIEAAGLPEVVSLLDKLQHWRRQVIREAAAV
jgi:hypothetical protein